MWYILYMALLNHHKSGRRALLTRARKRKMLEDFDRRRLTGAQIAEKYCISRQTMYRYAAERDQELVSGPTTAPIPHDASASFVQEALNAAQG